jgi:hypothetical protein
MYNLEKLYVANCTYQVKDGYLRVPYVADALYKYNYVMYKNAHFTDKYFYAFITKIEYVNENTSYVYLETDVFNTWFYGLNFNQSFIERQHIATDDFNTLSDSVPTGQLVEKGSIEYNFSGGYFVFCSGDITKADTSTSPTYTFKVSNYSVPCMVLYWDSSDVQEMSQALQLIANKGWGDRILSATFIPYIAYSAGINVTSVDSTELGISLPVCTGFDGVQDLHAEISYDFSRLVTHKKSLTYPYAKIVIMDMTTGQSVELSPEKFDNMFAEFQIQCSISEVPSYKVIPKNYDGQFLAYNQALVTRCSTSLPVANNTYAKYMMMNGDMNHLKMGFAGLGILGSAIGGNPSGVIGGIHQITNVIAQESQAAKLPNQLTSITDGAQERILFQNGVKISLFMMDNFHQGVADEYWNMFGYPVRKLSYPLVRMPNKTYNYIKMLSPNITGNGIPQEDMMKIEEIFTKGVTLWHTPASFRQY